MGDRYHYDKRGKYTGKSSNTPPGNGIGWVVGVAVVGALAVMLLEGASWIELLFALLVGGAVVSWLSK
jgi:hypothetical protein